MKRQALAVIGVAAFAAGLALVLDVVPRREPAPAPAPAAVEDALAPAAAETLLPAASETLSDALERVRSGAAQAAARDDGSRAGPPSHRSAVTGIHIDFMEMSEASRHAMLRMAVRDANFPCEAVNSASALADLPLWRVSCAGAQFYMVRIDELQDLHVEPILWDSPLPGRTPILEERNLELLPAPATEPER